MTYTAPPRGARSRSADSAIAVGVIAGLATGLIIDVAAMRWAQGQRAAEQARTTIVSPSTPPKATRMPRPTSSTGAVPVTDNIRRGIVLINATVGASSNAGTGLILTTDGQVATNYHVVRSSEKITVTIATTGKTYTARMLGRSATKDIALLQLVDAQGLDTIIPDKDDVLKSDYVVAAGNAGGQGFLTAFGGTVVGANRSVRVKGAAPTDPEETLTGLLETTALARPGDSGGPLFDAQGEVTGMTTAGTGGRDPSGTAFAIPLRDALDIVERIRARDETNGVTVGPKPFLGITTEDNDEPGNGLKVLSVTNAGPAWVAGIRSGDYVMSLNGVSITNRQELTRAIDALKPGATVQVSWRTTKERDRTGLVTLKESPYN